MEGQGITGGAGGHSIIQNDFTTNCVDIFFLITFIIFLLFILFYIVSYNSSFFLQCCVKSLKKKMMK